MPGKGAVLAIRIVSDASGAKKGFDDANKSVGGFQAGLDKASVASAGVVAGIGAMAKEAYDAASALQQSSGAIETVFDAQAAAVADLASKAVDSVGLSQNSYQELAALMGSQLKVGGIDSAALVPTMDTLMQRGADLAATFGGTTADAVAALSSALKGERDPIERYGISLSQAAVDAKVSAMGLDTGTEAAKKHAQTLATLGLIMEQSAASNGTFAREADTAAGQTQRAGAQFENAKAALGDVLLPVVATAAEKLAGLAKTMADNKDIVLPLVGAIGALAAVVMTINAVMKTATAIQWAVNAAMAANPVVLLVLAIAALAAGFVIAYKKVDWFREGVQKLIGWLKAAWEWVKKLWDKLTGSAVGKAVASLFSAPTTVDVVPRAAGSVAGMFGAAEAGGPAAGYAPLYGAPLSALAGGGSTAGQGSTREAAPSLVVNVTMNGVMTDVVSAGRQLTRVLDEYATQTGRRIALSVSS